MTVTQYKGRNVPDAADNTSGADVQTCLQTLRPLIDSAPNYAEQAANPSADNDGVDTAGLGTAFFKRSLWINTSTGNLFLCVDNTTGAAVWKALTGGGGGLAAVVDDTSPQLGGDLNTAGKSLLGHGNDQNFYYGADETAGGLEIRSDSINLVGPSGGSLNEDFYSGGVLTNIASLTEALKTYTVPVTAPQIHTSQIYNSLGQAIFLLDAGQLQDLSGNLVANFLGPGIILPTYQFAAERAPNANDDGANSGGMGMVQTKALWEDDSQTPPDIYVCQNNATGAAVWLKIAAAVPQNLVIDGSGNVYSGDAHAPTGGGGSLAIGANTQSSANGNALLGPSQNDGGFASVLMLGCDSSLIGATATAAGQVWLCSELFCRFASGAINFGANTTILAAPTHDPGGLANSQMQPWIDEAGNTLNFSVQYSDGTTKTATIPLL